MMMPLVPTLIIGFSYLLGCCTTGYYLVRLLAGRDIRQYGSGSVGARNVSRMLGFGAGSFTFCADAGKGALVVWLATTYGLNEWGRMATMLAVVSGHVWPLPLGFRGGKGIATSIGATLVLDLKLALILLLLCGLFWALSHQLSLSGMITVAVAPIMALTLGHPLPVVLGLTALTGLVLIAHRANLHQIKNKRLSQERTDAMSEAEPET